MCVHILHTCTLYAKADQTAHIQAIDAERAAVIAHLVAGPLFAQADTRAILLPPLMKQLFITARSPHTEEADNALKTVLDTVAHLADHPPSPGNSPRGPATLRSSPRNTVPEDVVALFTVKMPLT